MQWGREGGGGTTHPTIMVGASKAATTNSAEATGVGHCNGPAIPVASTTTYAVVSRIGGTPHFGILVVAVESFISDVDDSLPFTLWQESDEGTTVEILLQKESYMASIDVMPKKSGEGEESCEDSSKDDSSNKLAEGSLVKYHFLGAVM
jgi:hypothetical protein